MININHHTRAMAPDTEMTTFGCGSSTGTSSSPSFSTTFGSGLSCGALFCVIRIPPTLTVHVTQFKLLVIIHYSQWLLPAGGCPAIVCFSSDMITKDNWLQCRKQ